MKIFNEILNLETSRELEIINITDKIISIVKKSKIKNGILNLFSRHTTLAIKINEDEELLMKDFYKLMERIAPENEEYHHDKIKLRKNCLPNEPKNAKGHLRTLLLETSQIIPIKDFRMQLGTYQQIFAIETSGAREREIVVQVIGE